MLSDIYIKSDYKFLRFSHWHLIIPVVIGFIIAIFAYPSGFSSLKFVSFLVVYSLAIGIPTMKGFEYIEWKLEQHVPWLKKPNQRFFLSVFLEVILGVIILITVNYLIYILIQRQEIGTLFTKTFEGLKYLVIFVVIGVILINSSSFFKNWKQAVVNEEKLEREKLVLEYEALKNQVNPHFLFNSLTALSSLVHSDQTEAVIFIKEFSNVYRYVLESHDKEIVDLATEKNLLKSISFLYHIRHEEALHINIDIPDVADKFIIPMALQMLLENSIKHNTISPSDPLVVEIFEEGDYIVVKNNLQPKTNNIASNRIGLENIISRYKYLSEKQVLVTVSDRNFIVKIPVLTKYGI